MVARHLTVFISCRFNARQALLLKALNQIKNVRPLEKATVYRFDRFNLGLYVRTRSHLRKEVPKKQIWRYSELLKI